MSNDTALVMDDSPLYTHPKLREQKHEALLARLDIVRARRLVAALDHKTAHDKKMAKLSEKLGEQWERQDTRNTNNLVKVNDLITTIEKGIQKQIELGHTLELTL